MKTELILKRGVRSCLALGIMAGTVFASVTLAHVPYPDPQSPFEATVNLAEPERERIQKHLAIVEADLRAHPPSGLTAAQMSKRLALLDTLKIYREQGVFPRNLDFPDRLVPYFIDAAGVPCAMAKLVIASGHGDFAEEIRATMNNAYIGEIAAADGRLAAWGVEHGITLDEAARVQPGYGPPRLGIVLRVRLDSLKRPWVYGPDGNNIGAQALFYRDSSAWKLGMASMWSQGFCVAPGGEVLLLESSTTLGWNGRSYSQSGAGYAACEWAPGGSEAWIATSQGLARARRGGVSDTLALTTFKTPLGSDTVTGVAVTSDAVWAATARGVYRRGRVGSDTAVTAWDSVAIWGRRVTGIKPTGTRVWLGIEGIDNGGLYTTFSTRGLRRYNGSGWSAFVASQSAIHTPGDTIHALAVRDTGAIWVATPAGFMTFNGTTTQKVADIPAGVTVLDMEGDASGFYAATSVGVYHYNGTELLFLGQPAVSLRPGVADKRRGPSPQLRVLRTGEGTGEGMVNLQGRKAVERQAAGVYVAPGTVPRRE